MLAKRIIPCLDCARLRGAASVVKGVQFRRLRRAGKPEKLAARYCEEGADELVLLDIEATPCTRRAMLKTVRRTAKKVSIPFTAGGGIRSVEDALAYLEAGSEKVAVNTAALEKPGLLTEIARALGSQACVLAIDARRAQQGWRCYAGGGRVPLSRDAVAWAREGVRRGAGEVLLTSIDRDGTGKGYDLALTRAVRRAVRVPVIASGGAGGVQDFVKVFRKGGADAAIAAGLFHAGRLAIPTLKAALKRAGVAVRV